MNKKQLLNRIKGSSTIIEVVKDTKQTFKVCVSGTTKEPTVPTTKQLLEGFILEQREFNKNVNKRFDNLEVKVDNNTKMIKKNHSMIKHAHPELF